MFQELQRYDSVLHFASDSLVSYSTSYFLHLRDVRSEQRSYHILVLVDSLKVNKPEDIGLPWYENRHVPISQQNSASSYSKLVLWQKKSPLFQMKDVLSISFCYFSFNINPLKLYSFSLKLLAVFDQFC